MAKRFIEGTGARDRAYAVRLAADLGLPLPDGYSVGKNGQVSVNPSAVSDAAPDYMLKLVEMGQLRQISDDLRAVKRWVVFFGVLTVLAVFIGVVCS